MKISAQYKTAKRNIKVNAVAVQVSGEFGAEGEPAANIHYSTKVDAETSEEKISKLIKETDKVAEIHNTLRRGVAVNLMHS